MQFLTVLACLASIAFVSCADYAVRSPVASGPCSGYKGLKIADKTKSITRGYITRSTLSESSAFSDGKEANIVPFVTSKSSVVWDSSDDSSKLKAYGYATEKKIFRRAVFKRVSDTDFEIRTLAMEKTAYIDLNQENPTAFDDFDKITEDRKKTDISVLAIAADANVSEWVAYMGCKPNGGNIVFVVTNSPKTKITDDANVEIKSALSDNSVTDEVKLEELATELPNNWEQLDTVLDAAKKEQ